MRHKTAWGLPYEAFTIMPYAILILDGETRTALAVTRSLGKAGHTLTVASHHETLAGCSRYCKSTLSYPNPSTDPNGFCSWVTSELKKNTYQAILPLTDLSLSTLYTIESEVRALTVFPFSEKASFEKVRNKFSLTKAAKEHGIRSPITQCVKHGENLNALKLPSTTSVLKPVETLISTKSGKEKVSTVYVQSIEEARIHLEAHPLGEFLIQEHIEGPGIGISVLVSEGKVKTYFSHKRILEKPPRGGVSVLSKSIETDKTMLKKVEALLSSVQFYGVAMVEFKQTSSGELVLLEINPRFWGSLQLAIDARIDFPVDLVELCLSKREPSAKELTEEVTLRWELGCIDHALSMLKTQPIAFIRKVLSSNYFSLFSGTRLEVLRHEDPRPFFRELKLWLKSAL